MEPEFIGVVGGAGRMGALFGRLLRRAGYRTVTVDPAGGASDWKVLAGCPVILLAVPVTRVEDAMRRIGPLAREDGVIIDICSIKTSPIELMLEYGPGDVIGCHPLFGPSAGSLKDQTVFICPARGDRWLGWWRRFLDERGARTVEIDSGRHDRLMARVQVLRHLMLFSFGLTLARLDFDLDDDLPMAGPWFTQLVGLLAAQTRQPPDLYADLALHNAEVPGVLDEFMRAAGDVSGCVADGDRDAVIGLINEVTAGLRGLHAAGAPDRADSERHGRSIPVKTTQTPYSSFPMAPDS